MFYIKELCLRFYYIVFSFFIVLGVLWLYKKNLLTVLTFSLLNTLVANNEIFFEHLIYTNPAEVFYIYFSLVLYFSLLLIIPFFIWHMVDFLRSSLYKNEFYILNRYLKGMFCSVCLVNTFSILILFPYIWGFFNVFNKENELKSLLSFSLELRVEEYFNFFFTFLYLVNLSIFFVLILISFLSFLDLKRKLYWKKLFTFFNVVFATLLSPPDVFSQLVFLVVLVTLFELVMFFSILQSKLNKYL